MALISPMWPSADEAIPQPAQQLDAWLHDLAELFEAWREETGCPQGWDFGEESLDILETLVRVPKGSRTPLP